MPHKYLDTGKAVTSLWLEWVMSVGALTAVIVMGLVVDKTWLPVVAFGLELILYIMIRRNREAKVPVCYLLPFVTTRILFWTGVTMVIINLMYSRGIILRIFDPETVNHSIPYITVLIIAPIAFVVSTWAYIRHTRLKFCVDCSMRLGSPAERGFIGILYTQEGRYQSRMLMIFAGILSIVSWAYYLLYYVNVNLNKPDHFFFVWIPVLYTLMTFLYMGFRYFSIWGYYFQDIEGSAQRQGPGTCIRYIIIHGDRILLQDHDSTDSIFNSNKLDTPVTMYVPYRANLGLYEAETFFRNYTRIKDFKIRMMYSNVSGSADSNIFHYIITLDSEEAINGSDITGEWYTLPQIERFINAGKTAPLFSAEIVRLHTVTMAWKTYDRHGRRLYRIKNYRPTFRLRDIDRWDVDFNDPQWLYVAYNNQDKPFWRLKRFWRRYVNGEGE